MHRPIELTDADLRDIATQVRKKVQREHGSAATSVFFAMNTAIFTSVLRFTWIATREKLEHYDALEAQRREGQDEKGNDAGCEKAVERDGQ